MRKIVFGLMVMMIILFQASYSHAALIDNTLSFKVNIEVNNIDYQWSYINPDDYQYIKGHHVGRGRAAENEVRKMASILKLSPDAKIDDMVKALNQQGIKNIQNIEIRYIDQDNKLHTWVWHGKKKEVPKV